MKLTPKISFDNVEVEYLQGAKNLASQYAGVGPGAGISFTKASTSGPVEHSSQDIHDLLHFFDRAVNKLMDITDEDNPATEGMRQLWDGALWLLNKAREALDLCPTGDVTDLLEEVAT